MSNDENKSSRILLIGLLSILWLIITLVGYYYTHKPFTAAIVLSMLTVLWRIIAVVGIISISGGIGARIFTNRTTFPPLTALVFQAALGLGILGLVVLLMGGIIGFRPLYFFILTLVVGVWLRRHIQSWLGGWSQFRTLFTKNGLVIGLALGSGLILLWTLGIALTPPLHFDALTYHLALPHSYLVTGNMAYNPDNMFWGMPQQTEMLYTYAMALAGLEAAPTLGWGIGILVLIGLLGYVKEKINLTAAWVSVGCLLAGRSLADSLAWGYTEWPVMLYGMGVIVSLDMWRCTTKRDYLFLAAVFSGFALGSKYTAGQLVMIGLTITLWDGLRKPDRRVFANLLFFGVIATFVSLPWWVKNWLGTGNPFYPLLFPSGAMTQARLDYYNGTPWGSLIDLLTLPWQVTIWGVEGGQGFSLSTGPLLLGFGGLFWVGWQAWGFEQKRLISTAAIATFTGFIIWAIASRWNGLLIQTRLYAAFFPAWAILGGTGFDSLANLRAASVRFGRLASTVLLLVFSFNLIEIGAEVSKKAPLSVLVGIESPASYRTRNLGSYDLAMSALQSLPPDTRVLMLWETRSLACLPVCDPDEVIDRWFDDSHKYTNAEDTLASWREQGYSYLLLNVIGREFVQENDLRIVPESWNRLNMLLMSLPPPETVVPGYEIYNLETE